MLGTQGMNATIGPNLMQLAATWPQFTVYLQLDAPLTVYLIYECLENLGLVFAASMTSKVLTPACGRIVHWMSQ